MQITTISQKSSYDTYRTANGQDISSAFTQILEKKQETNMGTRKFLSSLTVSELYEVQKANHLAGNINIQTLSKEGAENLFLMPVDKYKTVDLNNDGVVEVGTGKTFVFPPTNSPESVKDAWKKASKDMSFKERMLLEGHFLGMQLERNAYQSQDGTWGNYNPGEDGWTDIFGNSEESIINLCHKLIYRIDNPLQPPTSEQTKHDEYMKGVLEDFINQIQ